MLAKLRARLAALKEKLEPAKLALGLSRRRYKARRKAAFKAHNQKERARDRADKLRVEDHPRAATYVDKEAAKAHAREVKQHAKAQWWLGQTKTRAVRVHKIETNIAAIEAEIKKLSHVTIKGNHVSGGTLGQRWRATFLQMAANCANAVRRNFYSMEGIWDILHELLGGPKPGSRSDCSSTVTGGAKIADAPDPNGTDWGSGWTMTLMSESNGWVQCSLAELEKHGWGYIVYVRSWSDREGHHTEAFVGNGRTVGHGSAPVDLGVPNLFGDGLFRCYIHKG